MHIYKYNPTLHREGGFQYSLVGLEQTLCITLDLILRKQQVSQKIAFYIQLFSGPQVSRILLIKKRNIFVKPWVIKQKPLSFCNINVTLINLCHECLLKNFLMHAQGWLMLL